MELWSVMTNTRRENFKKRLQIYKYIRFKISSTYKWLFSYNIFKSKFEILIK